MGLGVSKQAGRVARGGMMGRRWETLDKVVLILRPYSCVLIS